MAVLEKIRVKLGVLITVLIAVALLSFIIDPGTLETTLSYFSSKYDVGKIDGKKVRYNEFQKEVDYYTNIYTLTTPVFLDASGKFSRTKLLDFIHAIPGDASGNLAAYWSFLQQNMTSQQYFAKYTSLIAGSDILTPVELRRQIEENNTSSDAEFVLVPFGFKQDTTIKVSDKEIHDFYNAHKENYRQTASRDVEFVAYEVVPSEADINAAEEEINSLYGEFSTTGNLKSFLSLNSDTPLQDYYYKEGELAAQFPEVDEFAFGRDPGRTPHPSFVRRRGSGRQSAERVEPWWRLLRPCLPFLS